MSHPPETSLELAKRVHAIAQVQSVEEVAALIEAWVRVREVIAVKDEIAWWMNRSISTLIHDDLDCTCEEHLRFASASTALATARKQLREKGVAHGQAEAPSAAASANSEPGEA